MKKIKLKTGLLFLTLIVTTSFSINSVEKKEINPTKSTLNWYAAKISKTHNGTIKLKSGHFLFDKNKLVGGHFVVDMTSIICNDLKDDLKNKFEKDLASKDFFDVSNYPESTFKINSVKQLAKNSYQVTGHLIIKNISLENTFDIKFEGKKAEGTITIDRTKYGIIIRSANFFENLGLSLIYDNFDLKFSLTF